jgi:hypothetical protein
MADRPEGTGDPRVDGALLGLARVTTAPVTEHVAVFEETLDALDRVLASAMDPPTDPPTEAPKGPVSGPSGGRTTASAPGPVAGRAAGADPLA